MKIFFKEKPRSAPRVRRSNSLWQKIGGIFHRRSASSEEASTPGSKVFFRRESSLRRNSRNRFNWDKTRNAVYGAMGILILVIIIYTFRIIITLPALEINEFTFLGNRSVSDERLTQELNKLSGSNIFTLNESALDSHLKATFNAIETTEIRKIYPNRLFIIITERQPKLIIINIAGAYVIDDQSKVLEILKTQELLFSKERLEIAQGLGSPNNPAVEERLRTEFIQKREIEALSSEEQQAIITTEFNFETIPLNEKQRVLNDIEAQTIAEIEVILTDYDKETAIADYDQLPRVFVYENKPYIRDELIDRERLTITNEAVAYLTKTKKLTIQKIVWQGTLLVEFQSTDAKTYIFGTTRNITTQLEDLILVLRELDRTDKDYQQIDVSSEKVSVK